MNQIQVFNVAPSVPKELGFLEKLARNMWWCWNMDAIELFRRISPTLWRDCGHNPLEYLSKLPQKRMEALVRDDGFMSHLQQIKERFEKEVEPYMDIDLSNKASRCVAYFSLEYGIHESVKCYSGGLGILSGDHLKSSSDVGTPLVAVGLLYRQGYFQQHLSKEGWQQETYPENELHYMPLTQAVGPGGHQLSITIPMPEHELKANVWRLDVGRVALYLLDTNIPENPPELRKINAQLYGGDRRNRLRQEMLLGIGGFKALIAMGYNPVVCHMNEGHAAFVNLPRIAMLMKNQGFDKKTALELVQKSSVFTTHTPVPAGNESFEVGLLRPHLEAIKHELGIEPDEIISWGQSYKRENPHEISMTVLGLKLAQFANGVSELHGQVARKMWTHLWKDRSAEEVPIGHITNGIHVPSWLSPDNTILFNRYLGPKWRSNPADEDVVSRIATIPDEELWRAHELSRSRLVRTSREHLEHCFKQRNATRTEINEVRSVLEQDVLTIGFARRFATYKRGALLFKDFPRIEAILNNTDRPVQFIFAGKAHPADDQGKDLIRQIVQYTQKTNIRRHMLFLENYDMNVARSLVQGVDVWLNVPRRPYEASGTSGMKAAVNGVLNVSILDGWWCEGYSKDSGWAIGHGEEYDDQEFQDNVESQALYNILENEVIPTFYDRQSGEMPLKWLSMMKSSIAMGMNYFSSNRMISDYDSTFYKKAFRQYHELIDNGAAKAKELVSQKERFDALWHKVRVQMPMTDKDVGFLHVGDNFGVTSSVNLGDLKPDDVDIQIVYGPVDSEGKITKPIVENMKMVEARSGNLYLYRHEIDCESSGRYGFTARAVPAGDYWKADMPGFVTWGNGG